MQILPTCKLPSKDPKLEKNAVVNMVILLIVKNSVNEDFFNILHKQKIHAKKISKCKPNLATQNFCI